MTQPTQAALTPEVKAIIGLTGEVIEAWGVVDSEYLRRFTQALMDPDPRYWDDQFTRGTRYGQIVSPPIMVSYLVSRPAPDQEDPVEKAFQEDPMSDGVGTFKQPGGLPPVPTNLARLLNAGNEMEVYKYPSIGDKIYYQHRYSDVQERAGRDGKPFLIVTQETTYKNQRGELLCITRLSTIRR